MIQGRKNKRFMSQDYRKGCYSTKDLLARGWTRGLIKKLLGSPSYIHKFRSGRVAYLYIPLRVVEAEKREEWRKRRRVANADKRRNPSSD
jgi:hypothetical protein